MKTFSIFTIIALAVGLFIFAATRKASTQSQSRPGVENSSQAQSQWPKKDTSGGGIWITVQPVDLTSATWSFRVALTTHSGSWIRTLPRLLC